jgi:hypothetical protein
MRFLKRLLSIGFLLSTTIALACSTDDENQGEGPDGGGSDIGTDADSDGDSDSSSESEAVVTTLAGTTVLGALTDAEATQLCDDIWAYFETAISPEIFCKYKGLSTATSSSPHTEEDLRNACSNTEAGCLSDPVSTWANSNAGCSAPAADCAATVADYSTCIRDIAARFSQTVSGMSTCDAFTLDLTQTIWDFKGVDPPPSCEWTNCTSLWPPDPKDI